MVGWRSCNLRCHPVMQLFEVAHTSLWRNHVKTPSSEAVAFTLGRVQSRQSRCRGYEFSTILALPLLSSRKRALKKRRTRQGMLQIAQCAEYWREGPRQLPNHSHSLHICCINSRFLSHSSCPLCRPEVQRPEPWVGLPWICNFYLAELSNKTRLRTRWDLWVIFLMKIVSYLIFNTFGLLHEATDKLLNRRTG